MIRLPEDSCDCHLHVYGPADVYPVAPTSPSPPPDAPLRRYRDLMAMLGIARAVIVQPSAYGFDNRCTLDSMATLGNAARGVVVVPSDIAEAELERLTAAGVRGIRCHMLPGGLIPWEAIPTMAARVHAFGWHVQLQLDGRALPERMPMLRELPGDLVIDHTGKFLEPVGVNHPAFRALSDLVDGGRTWVKLSAPYETSRSGPPSYADVGALAQALVVATPERMLWGTNWPHPSAADAPPNDLELADTILGWIGDERTRRTVLVDNPAEVYGFGNKPGA